MTLTKRKFEILQIIGNNTARNGYPPTMREIADVLAISHVTVWGHIKGLRIMGLVLLNSTTLTELGSDAIKLKPEEKPSLLYLEGLIGALSKKQKKRLESS